MFRGSQSLIVGVPNSLPELATFVSTGLLQLDLWSYPPVLLPYVVHGLRFVGQLLSTVEELIFPTLNYLVRQATPTSRRPIK